MTVLHVDLETRSTVKLPDTGVYVYAENPDTDIWLLAYAFDDEDPQLWHPGEPIPQRVIDHIRSGGECRAHNAAFERVMFNLVVGPKHGWPVPTLEQWVCSAAEAAAMALPRSLGQLCEVTGVLSQKDDQGYRLMLQMCRPRRIEPDGTIVWWDQPEKIARLGQYCLADVRAEQAVEKITRRLIPAEREQYLLTERMNDRGIALDVELVYAAKAIADEGIRRANEALAAVTGGAVTEVTKVGQLKAWLETQGAAAESLSKAAVKELLTGDLDAPVRQVLELRAEAGRSSLAKLDSFLECACADGVIRGMLMYHGAATGRWTGRLAQLHNIARPEIDGIEAFIPLVLARDYDALALFHNPIDIIVSLLRSMLTAHEGQELVAADYSAIEARVLNWLADQADVLELFRRGDDVYSYNAGRFPGVEPYVPGVKHRLRQTGKFQELGCGYGMGAKKAISAGKTVYGLELTPEQAKEIVDNYRTTHPKVVAFWQESNAAAIEAVQKPGSVVTFGALRNLKFLVAGAYLYLQLPSGRPLCYAAPKVEPRETPWGKIVDSVTVSAVDSFTRKWSRSALYGGLIAENIVQAVSRDIMAEAKLRAEAAGFPPLLSVHDEVIAEGTGPLEQFVTLLATLPSWAAGCPITAEGWKGFRYRK